MKAQTGRRGGGRRRGLAGAAGGVGGMFEALESRVLLAADPIAPDHPLWTIPRGEAVIDGVLNEADWGSAHTVVRSLAHRADSRVTVRMMYNDHGLFLSVDALDKYIWADGNGGGAGNEWEIENDDSVTFSFDMNGSRDVHLQPNDRAFAVNLGARGGPQNGPGVVSRVKWIQGDGQGGAPGVPGVYEFPPYASTIRGTPNDNSDIDEGWTIEIFVPFSMLGMGTPVHGQTMGMTFDVIFDDSGGTRDLSDQRHGPNRFGPSVIDDHILGTYSSYSGSGTSPSSYAEVMFIDAREGLKPAVVVDLKAENTSAYGTQLRFTSPGGTQDGRGHVSGYEIRYSTSPILSEAAWDAATVFEQNYVPRLRGLGEQLRVYGLQPGTQYWVAVRGIDAAGNAGELSNTVPVMTLPSAGPGDKGRLVPSAVGGTLVFEKNGEAFVAVGDYLSMLDPFVRSLYPAEVFDVWNNRLINYSTAVNPEGNVDTYFALLQSRGVNTMRIWLELIQPMWDQNPHHPHGSTHLEPTLGNYNTAIRGFIHNLLEKSAQYGIHLIFSPFDTFFYDETFATQMPLSTNLGGPLSDINNFFQHPASMQWAKDRMDQVISWVQESPYAKQVIGWEPLNEWDSTEWTENPEGNGSAGREAEMLRRSRFLVELAEHIKWRDPDRLVMAPTVSYDPRGPVARAVFNSRAFDALTPHMYTRSSTEAINNPAADKNARAAIDFAAATAFWVTNRIDNKPMLVGEWGTTPPLSPNGSTAYGPGFTQQDDENLFRTLLWTGLASGQFGTPLRIPQMELIPNASLFTDPQLSALSVMFGMTGNMRPIQQVISRFILSTSLSLDWARMSSMTYSGLVGVTSLAGKSVLAFGSGDGSNGIIYLLHDRNFSSGLVTDGVLTLRGLDKNVLFDVEFWSTAPGTTGPLATVQGVFAGDGSFQVAVPNFENDLAVKIKARETVGRSQLLTTINVNGQLVTFALGTDGQPIAVVIDPASGATTTVDVSSMANFRGRVNDMTAFVTRGGQLHLALTDTRSHLWVLVHSGGNVLGGSWQAIDLTSQTGAPGLTGDLTTYLPSWGAIHIAGLDARGHAINYWWAHGLTNWAYTDLTAETGGPVMAGGLTGYVTPWDGLNLAGVSATGEVIVYWWAPGIDRIFGYDRWGLQNMTADFEGPRFVGDVDAFVTPWGGLNIVGIDEVGEIYSYWWAPGIEAIFGYDRWGVTNLTQETGTPAIAQGTKAVVSTDGSINVFGLDDDRGLRGTRWVIATDTWIGLDARGDTGGPRLSMPLAAGSAGNRMIVTGQADEGDLVIFSYLLDTGAWSYTRPGLRITA